MNKWFKIISISLLILIISFYLLNFMPIVKSNCGCINYNSAEKRVPLNYFVGCFCTTAEIQQDNFPEFIKGKFIQSTLVILPFILTIVSILILRKRLH